MYQFAAIAIFLLPFQALINFPKYIEPIKNGDAKEDDAHKLWRNIEPHLKKALQTVFLREVSRFSIPLLLLYF